MNQYTQLSKENSHRNKPKYRQFTDALKAQARRWLTDEKLSPELISDRWGVLGTIPIWVALLSQFFTDEKLTLYKALGVLIAFIGVALIMLGGSDTISFESESFWGNVITLACWGIYTILSQQYLRVYSPLQYSAFMSVVGLISLTFIGLPFLFKLNWSGISWVGFGRILYSGALSIGIAYIIWNNGVKKIGAVRTAAYQNLVPVLGLIFGLILLGEELTVLQYIGAGSVIAGIILARKKTRTELAKLSFKS